MRRISLESLNKLSSSRIAEVQAFNGVKGAVDLKKGETCMKNISLRIPELGFIAGTRGLLGAGLGLLLADKLNHRQQKRVGRVLLSIGAATTVPILLSLIRKGKRSILRAA
jgi:hypothetical protein